MRIMVVGLGSMGRRRIRLIKELCPQCQIVGVDGREDRCQQASSEYGIECVSDIGDVATSPEYAFVCTSPQSHSGVIGKCLNMGCHVFSEINLIDDGYDDNIDLARRKGVKLFLSSTFLYREETKFISDNISDDKKYNYIYHIGQYLPDWHPWEKYNDFFVGDVKTNGCREIFAIELPWLVNAFGAVSNVKVLSDKLSDLDISYDDNFMVLLEHENGNKGTLVVDVVSPCAVRKLEVYSENEYMSWDGSPDGVRRYNAQQKCLENVKLCEEAEHIEGYSSFIIENAYRNEIRAFFDCVNNKAESIYGFENDKGILKIIDSIGA